MKKLATTLFIAANLMALHLASYADNSHLNSYHCPTLPPDTTYHDGQYLNQQTGIGEAKTQTKEAMTVGNTGLTPKIWRIHTQNYDKKNKTFKSGPEGITEGVNADGENNKWKVSILGGPNGDKTFIPYEFICKAESQYEGQSPTFITLRYLLDPEITDVECKTVPEENSTHFACQHKLVKVNKIKPREIAPTRPKDID